MYVLVQAAITKCHILGGLQTTSTISQRYGGQESTVWVLALPGSGEPPPSSWLKTTGSPCIFHRGS